MSVQSSALRNIRMSLTDLIATALSLAKHADVSRIFERLGNVSALIHLRRCRESRYNRWKPFLMTLVGNSTRRRHHRRKWLNVRVSWLVVVFVCVFNRSKNSTVPS